MAIKLFGDRNRPEDETPYDTVFGNAMILRIIAIPLRPICGGLGVLVELA